ncbi:MAG: hypothetical protein JW765_02320 [Deltaproteobacteria bacterium]|nr:hypothetical protein [Candidatus Zymogenaceae bacterium]
MRNLTAVFRAFIVWLVLMWVEVVHGTLRTIILAPRVGDFCARQIAVFTGSLLILVISFFMIGWVAVVRTRSLIMVGLLWLVLTVTFELGLGLLVFGYSWERMASDYNIVRGGLMPIGLAVLFFSPLIASRLRARLFVR